MQIRPFLGFVLAVILSIGSMGCVSALNVHKVEVLASADIDPRIYSHNVAYAKRLAEEYIYLSDRAAAAQDAAALGIIATASLAAGALLYEGSLDLVKGAGLAAGTLTATTTYFRPGETSGFLLKAAEQLYCIVKVSYPKPKHGRAVDVLRGGISKARLNLRKNLKRELPDYRSLVDSFKQAVDQPKVDVQRGGRSVSDLQAEIDKCLLP